MQFEDIRPVLSGIAGGLVAMGLFRHWAKWLPKGLNGKPTEALRLQYRAEVWLANIASAVGLLGGLALYYWGGYASNDWRPLALGLGFSFSAPLVVLPVVALLRSEHPREAYTAYSLAQKTPPLLLYTLLAVGVSVLALAVLYW